tara:strand:+ start:596 stop:1627 length:1032 start_codon:yes stop_codon:yes gene_type:complete
MIFEDPRLGILSLADARRTANLSRNRATDQYESDVADFQDNIVSEMEDRFLPPIDTFLPPIDTGEPPIFVPPPDFITEPPIMRPPVDDIEPPIFVPPPDPILEPPIMRPPINDVEPPIFVPPPDFITEPPENPYDFVINPPKPPFEDPIIPPMIPPIDGRPIDGRPIDRPPIDIRDPIVIRDPIDSIGRIGDPNIIGDPIDTPITPTPTPAPVPAPVPAPIATGTDNRRPFYQLPTNFDSGVPSIVTNITPAVFGMAPGMFPPAPDRDIIKPPRRPPVRPPFVPPIIDDLPTGGRFSIARKDNETTGMKLGGALNSGLMRLPQSQQGDTMTTQLFQRLFRPRR